VLADIIRVASGKPWSEFLKERVFDPLGMTATRTTSVTDIVANRADGYVWNSNRFENSEHWLALRPSGAFMTTVLDLTKWEAALHTDLILTASSKAAMWTWVKLNDGSEFPYGFGWQLNDWPADSQKRTGVPLIRHGGTIPGFRATLAMWPSHQLSVIVLTNRNETNIEGILANIAVRVVPQLQTTGN
jgi:CubicO group peptidase (beta-lactamase class C family)